MNTAALTTKVTAHATRTTSTAMRSQRRLPAVQQPRPPKTPPPLLLRGLGPVACTPSEGLRLASQRRTLPTRLAQVGETCGVGAGVRAA
jgi:hypothetical protein